MNVDGIRARFPWEFAAVASSIYLVALWVVAMLETTDRPGLVAAGVTADLTLLVPALYWWTCVRRRRWPWITVVPVLVVSVFLASWVVPTEHDGLLSVVEFALVPLELAFVGYIGWRAHRGYRAYREDRTRHADRDPVDAIRTAVAETIPVPAAARAAAYEIAILYLALVGWRLRPADDERQRFTCYRDSSYGAALAGLMMVMVVELVGAHIALHVWVSPTLAWIVSIVTAYTAFWLIGDFQAFRLRPIVVEDDRIRLRFGMRWEADIPLSAVRSCERAGTDDGADLKMTTLNQPTILLELSEPVRVIGLYGLAKEASRILVAVDDPERFRHAVASRS